jgi:hypothetical protein
MNRRENLKILAEYLFGKGESANQWLARQRELELTRLIDEKGKRYSYGIVANIIGKHHLGNDPEVYYGTKHFSSNTKVLLLPEYGGMGHESIPVYGKARYASRKIKITLTDYYLKNLRVKAIYREKEMIMMEEIQFYHYFGNSKTELSKWCDSFNSNRQNKELS